MWGVLGVAFVFFFIAALIMPWRNSSRIGELQQDMDTLSARVDKLGHAQPRQKPEQVQEKQELPVKEEKKKHVPAHRPVASEVKK
ncbi:MAG: hypothetical protein OXT65_01535, partial [Alphaproteobacteria bacterium]|nr:hypothetical protein [Alphaproteobacteria bacterium]